MPELAITPLDDLTVLDLRGLDVIDFLNGQVSHDVRELTRRGSLLAGLHNPQGRVLAVLRLLQVADTHVLAIVPQELAETVRGLLQRYVLRARVKIEAAGATWRVYGLSGPDAEAAASTRLHMAVDASGLRQLIVAPRTEVLPDAEPADREFWRLEDIEAGIPEVGKAVSGLFVAQMLNLDRLDAISFNKGCYTGQEIIARAHFRGQVKRRMQRFATPVDAPLLPGARIRLDDGRAAQVVMAAPSPASGQEFLAVATVDAGVAHDDETPADAAPAIPATPLPLPGA